MSTRKTRKTSTSPPTLERYTVSAERHDDALDVPWWAIAARLPNLSHIALRLAWEADRPAVILAAVLQVLSAAVTGIGLYATTTALTPLFAEGPTTERLQQALPSLVIVALCAAVRAVVKALTIATTARIGPRVDGLAETRYLDAATGAPLVAYDDPEWSDRSEAASRAAKDAHKMIDALSEFTGAVLGLLAAAGVLTHLHPVLLPLLLLGVIPRAWATVRGARAAYLADRHTLADRRLRHTWMYLTAGRDSALEVRACTMRPWMLDKFRSLARRLENVAAAVGRTRARYQLVGDTVAGLAGCGVYAALLWLTMNGHIHPAAAGTAFIALQTSQRLLQAIVEAANECYGTGLYLADWKEFLNDTTQRVNTSGAKSEATPAPSPDIVHAHRVTFTYPGGTTPALHDVTATVRRGETLAIVGANGSGKSTLAKLLAGLYTPETGAVTWNHTDLTTTDPERLWEQLALLPQHFGRWPVTARENITLGQGAESDEDVERAARTAGADSVIASFPHGLDTNLAPSWWGGRDLSGGQWQRIATARAFYRTQATLLIADEPTSALDPLAEEAAYEQIRTLGRRDNRTVVLISHRLGATRAADHIIVLDHGRIAEEGTHTSLLDHGGLYAIMWQAQADTYTPIPIAVAAES